MKYVVRIPERIEHVVVIESVSEHAALNDAYEIVMNGDPQDTFGDNYSVESLGTDGAYATIERN